MRCTWLLGVVYLVGGFHAAHASEDSIKRDATVKCVNSTGGACALPIYALYSGDLTRYADLQIITTGFLRKVGRDYLLFADEGQARFAVSEQAFVLVDQADAFEFALKENDGAYVQVAGKIREPERSPYWAEIILALPPQAVPVNIGDSYPPPPPPDTR